MNSIILTRLVIVLFVFKPRRSSRPLHTIIETINDITIREKNPKAFFTRPPGASGKSSK
jgi:hypothetical protein